MKTYIQFQFHDQDSYLVKAETKNNKDYDPSKEDLVKMIRFICNLDEEVLIEDAKVNPEGEKSRYGKLIAKFIYPNNENLTDFNLSYKAKLINIFD
jgi:hypothetical protein